MNYDDILIGDEGVTSICNTAIEHWTLQDFINDMKSWANEIPKYKQGHRELWQVLQKQYQGLATWHECYLAKSPNKKNLEEKIYSDLDLLSLKPRADLSAATYNFIERHFYPRLGYLWRDLAPSPDHLWAFFEYSLFYQQVHKEIDGAITTNKTVLLKKLHTTIKSKEEWLENIDYIQDKRDKQDKQQLPPDDDETCKIVEVINKGNKIIRQSLKEIKENPIVKLHELIFIQSDLVSDDRNFRGHYKNYLNEWDIYRQTVKNSPHFQVCYLNSNGTELEHSKRGRPKSVKKAEGIPALQNKNMNHVSAMECPSCTLTHIRRNGKQPGGKQKYICVNCKHQFIDA